MARIMVAGGLDDSAPPETAALRLAVADALGSQIIEAGHVLLGGCRTELDGAVAAAAARRAATLGIDPSLVIRSWVTTSTRPIHSHGQVLRSVIDDWQHIPTGYDFPEPVLEADVAIFVGGFTGTQYAATWVRLANKPLVPAAALGLASAEIFRDEVRQFAQRYGARVPVGDYQALNQILDVSSADAPAAYAAQVLALAERIIRPTDVFVIMSFREEGDLVDAYDSFQEVCAKHGYRARRVDATTELTDRIMPAVFNGIDQAAFVIADLTVPSENVYYELGYAQGKGKPVIVTAHMGTERPFDVNDLRITYWAHQKELKSKLSDQIQRLGRATRV